VADGLVAVVQSLNDLTDRKESNGFTLYIVLVLFTIFSILASVIFLEIRYVHEMVLFEKQQSQTKLLAKSGIIRAEYFLSGGDGHGIDWETPDFTETIPGYGTIKISIQKFGVFSKITSTGTRLKSHKIMSGICGRNVTKTLANSLTLSGHLGGMILPVGSDISGNIVLDHGSVYREKNGPKIPEYQNRIFNQQSSALPFDSLYMYSVFTMLAKNDTLLQKRTDVVNGDITITNQQDTLLKRDTLCCTGTFTASGVTIINKVISAKRGIKLLPDANVNTSELYTDSAMMDNCNTQYSLLFTRSKIHLDKGNHNTQFFTRDSIVIGDQVVTGAFSVFACLRDAEPKDSVLSGGIVLADNAKVNGILMCSTNPTLKKIPRCGAAIMFGKKCRVNGLIITDNDINFADATISGYMYVRSVVTSRNNMATTNCLFNVFIQKPCRNLPFFMTGKDQVKIVMDGE